MDKLQTALTKSHEILLQTTGRFFIFLLHDY